MAYNNNYQGSRTMGPPSPNMGHRSMPSQHQQPYSPNTYSPNPVHHQQYSPNPSQYSPNLPHQRAATAPPPTAEVAPGSLVYTTRTGPSGETVYDCYRAESASYQTPDGIVSGIQWIPVTAKYTSAPPPGAQPANAEFAQSWARGGTGMSDKEERSLEDWRRHEEKKRRKEEKRAAKKLQELQRHGGIDEELYDNQSTRGDPRGAARSRRSSFNHGAGAPATGFPSAGPTSPYGGSNYSVGARGDDLDRRFGEMDVNRSTTPYGAPPAAFAAPRPKSSMARPADLTSYIPPTTAASTGYGMGGYAPTPIPPRSTSPFPEAHPTGYPARSTSPFPGASGQSSYGGAQGGQGGQGGPYGVSGGQPVYPRSRAASPNPYPSRSRPASPNPLSYPRSRPASPNHNYPRSRAASPNPVSMGMGRAMPGAFSSGANAPPPPQPEGFTRPVPVMPMAPFEPAKITTMGELVDHLPRLPTFFQTHDVYHEDWSRFVGDLSLAWLGRFPGQIVGEPGGGRRETADIVLETWNTSFFNGRGIQAAFHKRRSHGDEDSESETSSSESESESDDEADYGRQSAARRQERKLERKQRRRDKKTRRKAKRTGKKLLLYLESVPPQAMGVPAFAQPQGHHPVHSGMHHGRR